MPLSENQAAFQARIARLEAKYAEEPLAKKKEGKGATGKVIRRGSSLLVTFLILLIAAFPLVMQKFPEKFALPTLMALAEGADENGDESE